MNAFIRSYTLLHNTAEIPLTKFACKVPQFGACANERQPRIWVPLQRQVAHSAAVTATIVPASSSTNVQAESQTLRRKPRLKSAG